MTTILHNPRCQKSRMALALLIDNDEPVEIIEYLKNSPSKERLTEIVKLLGIKPEELIRKGETVFKEKFKDQDLSDNEWIDAMIENPKLIERPIVIKNGKAVIGRPPEKALDIL